MFFTMFEIFCSDKNVAKLISQEWRKLNLFFVNLLRKKLPSYFNTVSSCQNELAFLRAYTAS